MMVKKFLSVAEHIIHHPVHDSVSEQIGKIKDVFIDPDTSQPVFVIIATGGVLGIGSHHIALPWHILEFNAHSHDIKLKKDRHKLKNAPELDVEKLRNADREEMDKMFRYYGEAALGKKKDTSEEDNEFEEPDPHHHQAYEGSDETTDEGPRNQPDQASENMSYEKPKGFKQE